MPIKRSPDSYPGERWGRLVIKSYAGHTNKKAHVNCLCDCGNAFTVSYSALQTGNTKSCGCIRQENIRTLNASHRMSNTPEYTSWRGMMDRCSNSNHSRYHRYGGRGITVCERWHSFENFLTDMGKRPPKLTLDRIDNDKNYEPGNCRWTTYKEQTRDQIRDKLGRYASKC